LAGLGISQYGVLGFVGSMIGEKRWFALLCILIVVLILLYNDLHLHDLSQIHCAWYTACSWCTRMKQWSIKKSVKPFAKDDKPMRVSKTSTIFPHVLYTNLPPLINISKVILLS
jgi:hypothetical protein